MVHDVGVGPLVQPRAVRGFRQVLGDTAVPVVVRGGRNRPGEVLGEGPVRQAVHALARFRVQHEVRRGRVRQLRDVVIGDGEVRAVGEGRGDACPHAVGDGQAAPLRQGERFEQEAIAGGLFTQPLDGSGEELSVVACEEGVGSAASSGLLMTSCTARRP